LPLQLGDEPGTANRPAGKGASLQHADGIELLGCRKKTSPVLGGAAILPEIHIQKVSGIATAEVGGGARPGVLLDTLGKGGAEGVSLHIAKRNGQMGGVKRAGIKAILPEVASAAAAGIQINRIAAMGSAERGGEGIRFVRYGNQMNMIRHEAVGQDAEARVAGGAAEQGEVDLAVGTGEEDALAIGSALRHVMGRTNCDGTCKSRHSTI